MHKNETAPDARCDASIDRRLAAARQLARDGRIDEARHQWHSALAMRSNDGEFLCRVATAMHECGLLDDAIGLYRLALPSSNKLSWTHNNLGVALRAKGQFPEALAQFMQACQLAPNDVDIITNAANAHKALGQFDAAVAAYRRALRLRPHVDAHVNLGNLLQKLGQSEQAEAEYMAALSIDPMCALAESNLLFLQCHRDELSATALFDQHRAFGERYAHLAARWQPPPAGGSLRDAPLRVGFVSADLRQHPVAALLEPVMSSLVTDPRLVIHAYHSHPNEDLTTQRFRALVPRWRNVSGADDAELERCIREDRIDILIDLSGHTAMNRLTVFARKPAPLQVSWLGYPFSTGLAAMDYFICDAQWVPAGLSEACFVEKLIRLPVAATFQPPVQAPEVNSLPQLSNGYITFGSFNRLSKVNEATLSGWLDAMRACAASRLLIGSLSKPSMAHNIGRFFAENGIAMSRLRFALRQPVQTYLGLHGEVDVLLDSRPYSGGTTTLYAAWMGCPTLTLAGTMPHSRQSAAIMLHLGLEEFVAKGTQDFIEKAQRIAANPVALSATRHGLRSRLQGSTICQPRVLSQALGDALTCAWQHWLDGHPAKHFSDEPFGV
jgi:protein O-GlcNAc transferase